MSDLEQLVTLAAIVASPTSVVVVLLYLFKHPEKVDQWASLFYRLLYFLFGRWVAARERLERSVVASDIQATVNTGVEQLEKQAPGVLPYALKVQWVRTQDPESFVRDGEVVVRLDRHTAEDRNIVVAAVAYLRMGLLPRARAYVDRSLLAASQFAVAKRILGARRDTGAAEYFFERVLLPSLEKEPDLRGDIDLVDDLDSVGFFTRVFLTEVKHFGERVFPATPGRIMSEEIRAFAAYLRTIATKAREEDVPLTFGGAKIQVANVLVARARTLASVGIDAYIRRIQLHIREGFESIYICGWGEEYIGVVREIVRAIEKGGQLRILRVQEFPIPRHRGAMNRGILVACQTSVSYMARRHERIEMVRRAFIDRVPEISEGEIEILEIAREPEVGTKVAVRFAADRDDGTRASDICVGSSGKRLEAIKAAIPEDEWLGIVDWDADLGSYIVKALYTVDRSDITGMELDESSMEATVRVKSEDSCALAIGKDGHNVRLASELVGWRINVEWDEEYAVRHGESIAMVREALERHVPEIASGAIEIVNIVHEPGMGAKVAVKSGSGATGPRSAVQVCVGSQKKRYNAIKSHLPADEYLRIVDCGEDTASFITASLYPLGNWEVVGVALDEEQKRATVVVRDQVAARKAVGTGGQNVRLAQFLTGWKIHIRAEG